MDPMTIPLWLIILVTWLHVTGGVLWIGGIVYLSTVMMPVVRSAPEPRTRGMLVKAWIYRNEPIMIPIGWTTIGLGIIRGTVMGGIKSWDALFGTAYGITWFTALTLATVVLVTSMVRAHLLREAFRHAEADAAAGRPPRPAGQSRGNAVVTFNFVCFGIILLCMVLMRFGL